MPFDSPAPRASFNDEDSNRSANPHFDAIVQQQIAETPAAAVIANHAMGLYELAAIKLQTQPIQLADAKLAIDCLAAVVDIVRREIAPVVSLYVNDWNESARAVYEKVGFRETARFATVMF